ncbi:hypothetical protein AJ80_04156 [Polytolypa hystricis UAMH7299]|uniref:Uncharacterized protein n=1 Tax=Polytolypa hystricis (strain UAMH7299) TaxID=1447883 RepID=A0A2B7YD40_POLH7|nr:hypothetical protein AJ80_04156 [Polytolypa hystricis UAMH7299]
MKWPVRVLLLGGILFFATFAYLHSQRWRQPHPVQPVTKYFTWDNPDFAYFNNQFILHLASSVKNPLPNRKLISPGIVCPAVRGVESAHVIPVTDVFAKSSLEALGYETDPAIVDTARNGSTHVVDYFSQISEQPEELIRITAPSESYWQHSAFAFVRDSFILPMRAGPWRKTAPQFAVSEHLETCVRDMLPDVVPNAIGLHIRTWPSDLSFGQKDPCHTNEIPVLKHVWGKCEWTGSYLYGNVVRAQKHPEQPVVIATDDREAKIIKDLIGHLGDRAHFMDMTNKCKTTITSLYPEDEHEWRLATYWPIIEATALTRTEAFVGSFWSTLSQLVAVRRSPGRSFFFQTRLQAFIWDSRVMLGLIALVGLSYLGYVSVRRIYTTRRRRLESSKATLDLSA